MTQRTVTFKNLPPLKTKKVIKPHASISLLNFYDVIHIQDDMENTRDKQVIRDVNLDEKREARTKFLCYNDGNSPTRTDFDQ